MNIVNRLFVGSQYLLKVDLRGKMKRLIIGITLLFSIVVICFAAKTNNVHKQEENQDTDKICYSVYFKEIGTIAYPQIENLENKELQDKINKNLADVFENCISLDFGKIDFVSCSSEVIFQNQDYLSLKTILGYINPNAGGRLVSFPIYQTVSLNTGEILLLDDFLKIDEEFTQFLFDSPIAIKAVKNENADFVWNESEDTERRKYIKENVSIDDMLMYFREASTDYNYENYATKCAFYLTPHEINIVYETEAITIFYFKMRLDVDDIREYLKMDEW